MSNEFDPDWPHGHIANNGGTERRARYLGPIQHDGYPHAFAVFNCSNDEELWVVSDDGRSPKYGTITNAPAPKRKFVRWVNMYEHTATVFTYETKEIADRDASKHRTACIRVEFKEGDGL